MSTANLYFDGEIKKTYKNEIVKSFFSIMNQLEEPLKEIMNKSLEYKIDLTEDNIGSTNIDVRHLETGETKNVKFILFGTFDSGESQFIWSQNARNMLYQSIKNRYDLYSLFGQHGVNIINKLFKDKIKINKMDHATIPYFIAFLNPAFNLVKFTENGTTISYALIELEIEDNNNYDNIYDLLNVLGKLGTNKGKKIYNNK